MPSLDFVIYCMRVQRRRKSPQYLFPFLFLLCVGVLAVLVFQIGSNFFSPVKGDAVIYLAEGRAKILPFGKSEWENTYHGVKVRLGDGVKTLNGSKALISFYDGTVLRMNDDTEVTLIDITKNGDSQEILLSLNHGEIWVNKPVKNNVVKKTDFVVQTNNASYAITGTIFDLSKTDTAENLKVLRGEVQADILEIKDGKTGVVETVPVGIGQQINLDDAVMKSFLNRESPSVLKAIDTTFMALPWYIWNSAEDQTPTDFASGQRSALLDSMPNNGVTTNADGSTAVDTTGGVQADAADNNGDLSKLAAPIIVNPAQATVDTINGQLVLSGTVATGTKKVVVKQMLSGASTEEHILLNKFDPTTTSWKYNLAPSYNNILPGTNVYKIVGVDDQAKETAPTTITVNFKENNTTTTDATSTTTSDTTATVSGPVSDLKALTVATKTYSEGMKIDVDGFLIAGSVKNADKLFVNDYQLGKFKSGDTTWTYNVKESFGNLKEGENDYKVYAVGADGKKSSVLTIVINYTKPVTTDPTTTTPAIGSTPATSSTVSSGASAMVESTISINGAAFQGIDGAITVTADGVSVAGKVQNAEKVFVNDYQLTKFIPGSASWATTLKVSFGNLKEGVNTYQVYAVGADGTKSATMTLLIDYKPATTTPATTTVSSTTPSA